MTLRPVRRNMHIRARIGAIGERPEHRVGIVGIDILAHRDDIFADVGLQARGPCKRAPDFGARRAWRELHEEDLRRLLSVSCMATRRTPFTASVSRRCDR